MVVLGQSHLLLGSRIPDNSYQSYTIVRIVPTEVDLYCLRDKAQGFD